MIPIAPTSGESILQIGQASINPTIDFGGCTLINVEAPGPGSSTSTVATKGYVDLAINQDRQIVVGATIDVSGEGDAPNDPGVDDHVIKILTVLYDPSLPFPYATPAGTIAKVIVTRSNTTATTASSFEAGIVPSSVAGLPADVVNADAQIVTVVQYNPNFQVEVNVPKRVLEIDKCIKQYILTGSTPDGPYVWTAYPSANTGNILWPQVGVPGWYPAVQPL
jgi:hypothetical protein